MKPSKIKSGRPLKSLVLKVIDTYVYYVVIKKSFKQQLEQDLVKPQIQNFSYDIAS